MQREFNIFGPVHPDYHYHVDRIEVKAALRAKINKRRYFTLNAGRQTGKTTIFQELLREYDAQGDIFGTWISFETLRKAEPDEFYYWVRQKLIDNLQGRINRETLAWLEQVELTNHNGFGYVMRTLCDKVGKPGILIIDEFDAIKPEFAIDILAMFREMYTTRFNPGYSVLQSVILVGVRNVPSLLGGTQSPFNIADQYTVPYFAPDEVAALLQEHTTETGQIFEPAVTENIVYHTAGQPFLVNRLGQLLTEELVSDPSQPVTKAHLDIALAQLITENNSHFYSIISKSTPHRNILLPMLLQSQARSDFLNPDIQELVMYGVVRIEEDSNHFKTAFIANPIYRKMLLLRFLTIPPEELPMNGALVHNYVIDGQLHFDEILDSFKKFVQEQGLRLLKSAKSGRPLEISGQYLLLSYLTASLNNIRGHVTIESLSTSGEMDILVFFREQRFIVETKIWYSNSKYEEGKQQLVGYLKAMGLNKGYMVIFDENLGKNPLLEAESDLFEVIVNDKTLRIYLLGVSVDE